MLATVYNRDIQTSPAPPLRQAYLADAGELQLGAGEHLLGIIRHGVGTHASTIPDGVPTASLALETLDGTHGQEAWFTNSPVSYGTTDGIAYAHSGRMLFGVLHCSAEEPGASAQEAYSRIIGLVRSLKGGRLLRLWNYFPAINSLQDGLERYRRFCLGRHAALAAAGYSLAEDLPAASAIGTREGDFVIIFLAGAGVATQIENPRQVSAFRYPAVYGPRSPSFSRAIRFSVSYPEQASLLISGTASILGHETVHVGDPIRQCATTLDNLRTLLARVGEDDPVRLGRRASWKIYLRHREDLDTVRGYLEQSLNPSSPVLYLAGDICRATLLLEIEGLVELGGNRPAGAKVSPVMSAHPASPSTSQGTPDMPTQNALETELARLMVESLNLETGPEAIDPAAPLYQEGLGLDSIDLLELSVVIAKRYGFQIKSDDPDITRIFSSLTALAEAVAARRTL